MVYTHKKPRSGKKKISGQEFFLSPETRTVKSTTPITAETGTQTGSGDFVVGTGVGATGVRVT